MKDPIEMEHYIDKRKTYSRLSERVSGWGGGGGGLIDRFG